MNDIVTKSNKYDFSKMTQEMLDKYGATLLSILVFAYTIDKISTLANKAMENGYSFNISYDKFEINLKREELLVSH